jgi:cytochrome c oxidase cbb3-type subunit 3
MPGWWVYLFVATVLFSIPYTIYYMSGWGKSSEEYFTEEMRLAEIKYKKDETLQPLGATIEDLITAAKDTSRVDLGKGVFIAKCAACHGQKGEGLIGPNLTDKEWVHGGGLAEIYETVKKGVPAKGMLTWEGVISEEEIVDVSVYLRSIQNSNVAGKAAEGEVSEPTKLN